MIKLDFGIEQRGEMEALAKAVGDSITKPEERAFAGGAEASLVISMAALLVPAVKDIVVAYIKSRRFKSITVRGTKISAYSADDIERILKLLAKEGIDQ